MKKYLFILGLMLMSYSACKQNAKSNKFDSSNPFASEFIDSRGLPPFDLIKAEHYRPAFLAGIEQHAAEVEAIANQSEAPDFENTVVALDESGQLLNRVASVFFAMTSALTDTVLQAIETEMSPLLTEHNDNIYLNEKLFSRIKAVYDDPASHSLTTEQKRLLEKYYKDFVRSGIALEASKKERLREINKELGLLNVAFGENLLAETNNFQLIIDKKEDLSGLPQNEIDIAGETAKAKGLDGKWVFTLSKPSWMPFLKYADNRELRENLYKAMYNRCNNGNSHDNKEIIQKIVNLRLERANLLGYKTHADYKLEETMAKTPENALRLLFDIWKHALPQAKKERDELQKLIDGEGGKFKLQSWDWWYYAEKLRQEKYALNEEELRPYFVLENVRNGAFEAAHKLYGVSFKEIDNVSVYQKDVKVFEVNDSDGSYIGVIYLDYFPRSGKRNGAWMGNFAEQTVRGGKFVHPVVYNVGNFALPTGDTPSQLDLDQVETLFHEFGHALHGLLSRCNYAGISGTNVYRDFVELPSQINEHWALHPEVLKMYAKHYQTGAVIPDLLIEKIKKTANFNQGFATTELVAAAILDMKWHAIQSPITVDVTTFENNVLNEIGLIPEIIVRYKSPYFSHIFDGGYSAGYYSYLWSEVLDADAFQAFEEKGIFDAETAKSFRENILSKGASDDPTTLYRRFRGADPNPDYLLKNRGFINN
ncbi:MAG: M3 family metallopeptidase [Dysgonamonadaceae bacterium]|jgi:peptidyl-dipeptidase Dcp|nr:M3 family metallopeptidase [Dysgonamonadaceae bacterium]